RAAFDFRQVRRAERLAQRVEREQNRNAANPNNSSVQAITPPAKSPDMQPDGMESKNGDAMSGEPKGMEAKPAQPAAPQQAARNPGPGIPQQIYLEEAKTRFDAAFNTEIGFVERLVWFWSNHFCVSADKFPLRALCGAYEREAIRTHVLGRFADMLFAVE